MPRAASVIKPEIQVAVTVGQVLGGDLGYNLK
jgi:hypothetical protein